MTQQVTNNNKTIAVIGAKGFVGLNMCAEIKKRDHYNLIQVIRGDDISEKIKEAEIVIHAANPAKRFFANNNPQVDFSETVLKTQQIIKLCKDKKLVLISSLSARTQLDTTYGRYRKSCEILANYDDNLVIRLGPMFGGTRTKDTLHDIMTGKEVFLSSNTKYSYTSVEYSTAKVIDSIDLNGLIEIGADNSISLKYIADFFDSKSSFSGFNDSQIAKNETNNGIDAYDVIQFCKDKFK
jgi:nucleoside-diphosphate-sugar epimerase